MSLTFNMCWLHDIQKEKIETSFPEGGILMAGTPSGCVGRWASVTSHRNRTNSVAFPPTEANRGWTTERPAEAKERGWVDAATGVFGVKHCGP